jgi:hypothetical protein
MAISSSVAAVRWLFFSRNLTQIFSIRYLNVECRGFYILAGLEKISRKKFPIMKTDCMFENSSYFYVARESIPTWLARNPNYHLDSLVRKRSLDMSLILLDGCC